MARALFVLAEENAARQTLLRLCTHRWFDAFILAVIVGNAVMMATEDPTQPDLVEPARDAVELACNVVFTAEMLVKIIAYGLVIGEDTYLRSGWNILVRPTVTFAPLRREPPADAAACCCRCGGRRTS